MIAPLGVGLAITGQTLTATEGTWTGTEPITYTYQWQQCSKAGDRMRKHRRRNEIDVRDPERRRGAHAARRRDGEKRRRLDRKGIGDDRRSLGVAPKNTEAPSVSGTATAGQLLTASSGKWTGTEPITYEYEWLRCNTAGASCTQAAAPSIAADVHASRRRTSAKRCA